MKMKLPNKDKLLHLIAGTYIYLIASVLLTPMLSILLVIIAGFAKEFIWDRWLGKGAFEWMDIVYTLIGCAIAILLKQKEYETNK